MKVAPPFKLLNTGALFGSTKVIMVSLPLSATLKAKLEPGELLNESVSSEILKSVASVSTSNVLVPLNRTFALESPVTPVIVKVSPTARSVMVSPDNCDALPTKLSLPALPVIESVPPPGRMVSAPLPPTIVSSPLKLLAVIVNMSLAKAEAFIDRAAVISPPLAFDTDTA